MRGNQEPVPVDPNIEKVEHLNEQMLMAELFHDSQVLSVILVQKHQAWAFFSFQKLPQILYVLIFEDRQMQVLFGLDETGKRSLELFLMVRTDSRVFIQVLTHVKCFLLNENFGVQFDEVLCNQAVRDFKITGRFKLFD